VQTHQVGDAEQLWNSRYVVSYSLQISSSGVEYAEYIRGWSAWSVRARDGAGKYKKPETRAASCRRANTTRDHRSSGQLELSRYSAPCRMLAHTRGLIDIGALAVRGPHIPSVQIHICAQKGWRTSYLPHIHQQHSKRKSGPRKERRRIATLHMRYIVSWVRPRKENTYISKKNVRIVRHSDAALIELEDPSS